MTRHLDVLETLPTQLDPTLLARTDLLLMLSEALARPETTHAPTLTARELRELFDTAGLPDAEVMAQALVTAREVSRALDPEQVAVEHNWLFGPEMICPIHETAYVRRDKGAVLGDIAAFYNAFGLDPRHEPAERPDHLRVELEFVAMLHASLALALASGNGHGQSVTASALASFVDDHVLPWVPRFAASLAATAQIPTYSALGLTLGRVCELLAHELGLSLPSNEAPPVMKDELGTPYECGMQELEPHDADC